MIIKDLDASTICAALTSGIRLKEPLRMCAKKAMLQLQAKHEKSWCIDSVTLSGNDAPEIQISRAKKAIIDRHGLQSIRGIPFYRGDAKHKRYYYLRPLQKNEKRPVVTELANDEDTVVLRLFLLSALLTSTQFGRRDVTVEMIGPRIYVGARSFQRANGSIIIDALEVSLVVHHDTLITTLSSRRYGIFNDKNAKIASGLFKPALESNVNPILSVLDPASLIRLDGRESKFDALHFGTDDIYNSKNYLLSILAEFFTSQMETAGILVERDRFLPQLVAPEAFVRLPQITEQPVALVIINATGCPLNELQRQNIEAALQAPHHEGNLAFSSILFHRDGTPYPPSKNTQLAKLKSDRAYLFLNAANSESGTSVRVEDEWLNNPFDAYDDLYHGAADAASVDPYTFAKYTHLYSNSAKFLAMQGLDLSCKDGALQLDDGMAEALRRCAVELAVKSCFKDQYFPVTAESLAGRYTLLHTTSRKIQRDQRNIKIVAVVEVRVAKGALTIQSWHRHVDIDLRTTRKLLADYPCLGADIQDDRFYIVDQATGDYLKRFTGRHIPKLLLNFHYESIDEALATLRQEGGTSAKGLYSRSRKWSIFPFYTPPDTEDSKMRNWRRSIFIEDRGAFLRYFAPSSMPLCEKPRSSNLYDVMVYRSNGTPYEAKLVHHSLVHLYLGSLTYGIARTNENSKTSLLEKIAKLAGLDT